LGQKIHPVGLRLGINRESESKWYASEKDFAALVLEDDKIRKFVKRWLALPESRA